MRRIYRALLVLFFAGRLYLTWSRLYRWLRERKYRKIAPNIPPITIELADQELRRLTPLWKRDGRRSLWDAVGDPHHFEAVRRGLVPPPTSDFDCDSFGAWTDRACIASRFCLSVSWLEGWRPAGHVVAVCRTAVPRAMWHLSNGGRRGPFDSLAEIVEDLLKGRPMIGWALFTWDLHYIACGTRKMPDRPEWRLDPAGVSAPEGES